MTTANALAFIRAVREDERLRSRIAMVPRGAGLEQLAALSPGLPFSADELDQAFRIDWTARWLHYGTKNSPA